MSKPNMVVMVLPTGIGTAAVYADGAVIGAVQTVVSPAPYEGLDGQTYVGERWLPVGVPATLTPGPTTKAEAALLLLALEGYDPARALKSLGLAS